MLKFKKAADVGLTYALLILVGIISTPVHTSSVKNDTLLTHTATLLIDSNIMYYLQPCVQSMQLLPFVKMTY